MDESDSRIIDPWVTRLSQEFSGRETAISELRVLLIRALTRGLRNRYGSCVAVEDIVQDALVKILASLDTFRGRSKFTTWAIAVATRIGISSLRRRYYRDVSLGCDENGYAFQLESFDSPDATQENREQREKVFGVLDTLIQDCLSEKQRQAIRGTLADLPFEEIASRMNTSRNTIYKLVHDAKLRLRKEFDARGFTVEDITVTFK